MASRSNEEQAKSLGNADRSSNAKAREANARAKQGALDSESWPRGVNGNPMMKVVMSAAELIPTGQYANVSIGPCQITAFVDPERLIQKDEAYFSDEERTVLAQALNELAEIVEGDVVAVQRNLVLEAMQDQISTK